MTVCSVISLLSCSVSVDFVVAMHFCISYPMLIHLKSMPHFQKPQLQNLSLIYAFIVDGQRVANGYVWQENKAYFTKKGLNRRNVLHELFHHVVENKGLEMTEKKEERQANLFVREIMKKR